LNQEVVQAVSGERFHIWPIETIDQALALLTHCLPGELDLESTYPAGSFNRAVVDQLAEFSKTSAEHPENHPPVQAEEHNQT
jgi:predicted ATP-dependent protease